MGPFDTILSTKILEKCPKVTFWVGNFFKGDDDNKWQILHQPRKYDPLARLRSKGHFEREYP